jgi:hypothetical protein
LRGTSGFGIHGWLLRFSHLTVIPVHHGVGLRLTCKSAQKIENRRADSNRLSLLQLRVITQALQGCARGYKSCISMRLSLLWVAGCCTVLRSRWYQEAGDYACPVPSRSTLIVVTKFVRAIKTGAHRSLTHSLPAYPRSPRRGAARSCAGPQGRGRRRRRPRRHLDAGRPLHRG